MMSHGRQRPVVVETTAIRAGIPMPRVGVIDDPSPNAFAAALSPKNAVIGVTTGALDLLDDSELEAVFAHEVAHIVNQDGRGTLTAFALVAFVLGPLISSAVSRRREFLADASGVELTRFPEGLVRAPTTIHAHPTTVQAASLKVRGLFFVHTIGEGLLAQWLGSHPPVAERVERLREVGRGF